MPLPTPESLAAAGTEHAHQVALFAWAALNFQTYPDLHWMFAIPNGGLRNPVTAANLKAEGVRAGVSDIFLPVSRGGFHGLFIELKKPGKKADERQLSFIAEMQRRGYGACVCVGWMEARDMLLSYLNYS